MTSSSLWDTRYAGWGPGQLQDELQREALVHGGGQRPQRAGEEWAALRNSDPADAGLTTWRRLLRRIGKTKEVDQSEGCFDDLMLREYALQRLSGEEESSNNNHNDEEQGMKKMIRRATSVARLGGTPKGTLVCAAKPFSLVSNFYHAKKIRKPPKR